MTPVVLVRVSSRRDDHMGARCVGCRPSACWGISEEGLWLELSAENDVARSIIEGSGAAGAAARMNLGWFLANEILGEISLDRKYFPLLPCRVQLGSRIFSVTDDDNF